MPRTAKLFLFLLLLSLQTQAQHATGAWKWFNNCQQSSGGYGYNRIWDMESDQENNLLVAGTYYKEAQFSGKNGTGLWLEAVGKDRWIANEKFFLAKYRKSGELAWIRTGIGGHQGGSTIQTDSEGNIYCLLSCVENLYLQSSATEEISYVMGTPNRPGTFLVKYSPEGNLLWHMLLDVHGVGNRDLDIGPRGELFLVLRGHYNPHQDHLNLPSVSGKDTSVKIYPPLPNKARSTTIVCQYDSEGELTWAKSMGADSLGLYGTGIAANPKGGFALGLHFSGHGQYLGMDLDSRIGGSHSLILNFDEKGDLVYSTQFGKEVYTQHKGGPPHFQFDPSGRLIVGTAVDYGPIRFSPAKGEDILLEGYNQYTCYLLLLRLNQEGRVDWQYVFKDIDFTGSGATIYPYWAKPALKELQVDENGQVYIVGSALNTLKLGEGIEYQYERITEAKHWRTRNPFLAAFDSCGNPFWLESIKVNRRHNAEYLAICLHSDGDLSFGSQIGQHTEYSLNGKAIVAPNSQHLLFGRRKRPQLSAESCENYVVIDTSTFRSDDSTLTGLAQVTPPDPPAIADTLPKVPPVQPPAPPAPTSCISALILFPNPNNGNFNLQWQIEEEQEFEIRLTNMTGQVLRTEKRSYPAGTARMQFMGLGLAQGVYIATISCKSDVQSIRFVVGGGAPPQR